MTSIPSAKQRASRWPALFEMSFRSKREKSRQRQGKKRKESRRDYFVWAPARSLLVILHYLLKNNITFMWGIEQGKLPPEARLVHVMIKSRRVSPEGGMGRIRE